MYAERAPGQPHGSGRSRGRRALPVIVVVLVAFGWIGACRVWVHSWDRGDQVSITSSTCLGPVALGTVGNFGEETVDVSLEIEMLADGEVVDRRTWTGRIEPGSKAGWKYRSWFQDPSGCAVRIAEVSEVLSSRPKPVHIAADELIETN